MGRKGDRKSSQLSVFALAALALAGLVLFVLFHRLQVRLMDYRSWKTHQDAEGQARLIQSNDKTTKVGAIVGRDKTSSVQMQDLAALQMARDKSHSDKAQETAQKETKDTTTSTTSGKSNGIGNKRAHADHHNDWKPHKVKKRKPGVNAKVLRNDPDGMRKDLALVFKDSTTKFMAKMKKRKGRRRRRRGLRKKTHSLRPSELGGGLGDGAVGADASGSDAPDGDEKVLLARKRIHSGQRRDTHGMFKSLMKRRWSRKDGKKSGYRRRGHRRSRLKRHRPKKLGKIGLKPHREAKGTEQG